MQGAATSRFALAPAPRGLCVVQELVNTATLHPAPQRFPDLLAGPAAAQEWLDAALARWADATGQAAPRIAVAHRDLGPLRTVREALRHRILDPGTAPGTHAAPSGSVAVTSGGAAATYAPQGTGATAVESLVAVEVLLAQSAGTFTRLKACPGPTCGVAFYDESKNGSRVWHDVRTCGNRHNLRASRARRRSPDA